MKKESKGLVDNSMNAYRPLRDKSKQDARHGKMDWSSRGGSFKRSGDSLTPRKA